MATFTLSDLFYQVFGAEDSESKEIWISKLQEYLSARNNPDDASPDHFDVASLVYR